MRARRGAQVAAVATARKLASLFWCLLTREQDHAYGQPSLTRRKIRQLELATGAPSRKGQVRAGHGNRTTAIRDSERALALQAEHAYRRTIADWKATGPADSGRERDTGARISKALEGQSRAADHKPLTSALRFRQSAAPTRRIPQQQRQDQTLTFSRQAAPTMPKVCFGECAHGGASTSTTRARGAPTLAAPPGRLAPLGPQGGQSPRDFRGAAGVCARALARPL